MEIAAIGVVRSAISDREKMPLEGVPARIDLSPEYEDGLKGIDENSHVMVIGWLNQANRGSLRVGGKRPNGGEPRGVFGLRSTARPNPLSLSTCRLVRVDGSSLYLDRLDLVDGTPIVDLKRYSPSWDSVFSARSSRDIRFAEHSDPREQFEEMMREASNFHGESCTGVALAVRLMAHAMNEWKVAQKDPKIVVHMGEGGCITDAVQALTGATLGNGRMKVPAGRAFRLSYSKQKVLAFHPRDLPEDFSPEDVLRAPIEDLFAIRADEYADGKGPHGGRPAKPAPSPEKQGMLLDRVRQSLVDGTLPCGVAHRIALDLKVSVPDVGWAADVEKVRITRCQLGCFK